MRMKIYLIMLILIVANIRCRQDDATTAETVAADAANADDVGTNPDAKTETPSDESLLQDCIDEERAIRIRGTYTLALIDTDFKLGAWKMTNTNQNGAEGRKEEADFTPNRLKKTRHSKKTKVHRKNKKHNKKNKKKEYKKILNSVDNKVRLETDRAIKEAMNLMKNGDVRQINLMQTSKIELPDMCKTVLSSGENIVVSQRARNMTDCWCMASNKTDTSGISYLSLPYLNVTQFGDFFICAGIASGYKDVDGQANGKFINLDDVKEYPEALFNMIKGKHIPGTPMSWLRFWVYLCTDGGDVKESVWKATEKTDPAKVGNQTYVTMFDEMMKKNIELAIKQDAAQTAARQSGVSYPDADMRRLKKHTRKDGDVDAIKDGMKRIMEKYSRKLRKLQKQKKHHRLKHKVKK